MEVVFEDVFAVVLSGAVKEHDLQDVVPVGLCDGCQLLGDDDGADPDVSSVEGQFYQFAGPVFYRLLPGACFP